MANNRTQLSKSVWNVDNLLPAQGPHAGDVLTTDGSSIRWAPVGGSVSGKIEIRFDFGDATPKNIFLMPANKLVLETQIVIYIPFNDATSTLSLGDAGNTQRFITTTDNIPTVNGTYTTTPGTKYAIDTQITLSISPGVSTQGSALVTITYET